jgi:hypothetical protein
LYEDLKAVPKISQELAEQWEDTVSELSDVIDHIPSDTQQLYRDFDGGTGGVILIWNTAAAVDTLIYGGEYAAKTVANILYQDYNGKPHHRDWGLLWTMTHWKSDKLRRGHLDHLINLLVFDLDNEDTFPYRPDSPSMTKLLADFRSKFEELVPRK